MSRFFAGAMLLAVVLSFAATAAAAADPAAFSYRGGGRGTVLFDHHLHASKGYACDDCHGADKETGRQLFQTRKQGLIDRAVHSRDESCFACHNGGVAFDTCDGCHRRP